MKTLPPIRPTGEQLPIISDNSLGIEVIRGAAGSGKTSTAILRLRSLAYMFEQRSEREGFNIPVDILVLTFNRTLSGYVKALVEEQVTGVRNSNVTVTTFGKWSIGHIGTRNIVSDASREAKIRELSRPFTTIGSDYLIKEVDYLLGRFHSNDLEQYIVAERTGRGAEPRVDRALRRRILDEIVAPYRSWLADNELNDWNDIAIAMAETPARLAYDIAIVDESQDFSANQLRALKNHISDEHAVTFVIDTIQRIYARGFTWSETGFDLRGARYHSLRENHRNTTQIAAFASGILDGMVVEADGTLPDLRRATSIGPKPKVIKGLFSEQLAWSIGEIADIISDSDDSIAFLSPQGGGFFSETRKQLIRAGIEFVDITREPEWPTGDERVALSTFHSAKGLEFDHVFILGLSNRNTPHGEESVDDQLTVLRRLLAVAVARARKTVTVGYKIGEESDLIDYFDAATFDEIEL